ncbi:MAG TPA: type III pantothenate kinase [Rhodanobacteraceae bacterium]|nr:type III pantothenate kinase [Rhodanobacteraceae bacterium]
MSAVHPETWLFDLGNSRAKAARLDRGEPSNVLALEWERPDFIAALRAGLERWPAPARVWVASVASGERAAKIRDALAAIATGNIEWLRTPRSAGGVVNRYAKPERLGIDRFLAMLAAHRRANGGCVVVGCGTALTLDAVATDGTHAEGMIALSPGRMLQTLHAATAIADRNPDAFAADVRDDTAMALQAGCWASAGSLVEWFVARARKSSGAEHVWLHGGWAGRLAEWLAQDGLRVEMLDDAVLHGLAIWAAEAPLCDHP